MKKLFTILILLACSLLTHAQELSVKSFHLAETDLTAMTQGSMIKDQNGNPCALIKLETTVDGFTFDVGVLGVREAKRVGGEIWIYVPFGIRKITLSHPQLGVIRDYLFPCSIDKGRTYIMTLITGTVKTIVEHAQTRQFLYIELNPQDAILEINGKITATDNGVYQELLPFGNYQYKVFCQDYHDLEGSFDIFDPDNTHTLSLKLKPAFGHISISDDQRSDIAGAVVYIDDKFVGTVPIDNFKLNSGSHRIRVIKEMYEAYNATFTISDEENKRLTPTLLPDFAEVTLQTVSEAELYINGELKGKGKWSGRLATGSYIFESRQPGHIAYKSSYDITRHDQNKTIELDAPTPIYGSLVISSTPAKAKISINGKPVGETPKFISKQVIGEYNVTVELDGYEKQTKTVNIAEGKEETIAFTLNKTQIQNSATLYTSGKERRLHSKEAMVRVGDIIIAELDGQKVQRWEVPKHASSYIEDLKNGKLKALQKGCVDVWGYIEGTPKLFKLEIVEGNVTLPGDKPAKMMYGREITIRVGDEITSKIQEGKVTRWEINNWQKEYIFVNGDRVLARKPGIVSLWGYVNDKPIYFVITIKR